MDTLLDIKGKVAVITGGSCILCGGIAKRLAERGARIGILGLAASKVEAMVAEIHGKGGEALPLVANVLDADSLQAACNKVLPTWGKIDILITGAGGNIAGAAIPPPQNFFSTPFPKFSKSCSAKFRWNSTAGTDFWNTNGRR